MDAQQGQRTVSSNTHITVLYFAAARTATGLSSERIDLPPTGLPLKDLAGVLAERHKDTRLGEILKTSMWSVNDEMVGDDEGMEEAEVVLKGGEEVAVICPVSGG